MAMNQNYWWDRSDAYLPVPVYQQNPNWPNVSIGYAAGNPVHLMAATNLPPPPPTPPPQLQPPPPPPPTPRRQSTQQHVNNSPIAQGSSYFEFHYRRVHKDRDELRANLKAANNRLNVLETKFKNLEELNRKQREELVGNRAEIERKDKAVEDYKRQYEELKRNWDQFIKGSESQTQKLSNALENEQKMNAILKKDMQSKQKSFEKRLEEKNKEMKTSCDLMTRLDLNCDGLNQQNRELTETCERLEAEKKVLSEENKKLSDNRSCRTDSQSVKAVKKSLEYYKKQTEINKRCGNGYRIKYLKMRRMFTETARKLHSGGASKIDDVEAKIMMATRRICGEAKLRHRIECQSVVDKDTEECKRIVEAVTEAEKPREDGKVACPLCPFIAANSGNLQIHTTTKHFLNERTIEQEVITLEDG